MSKQANQVRIIAGAWRGRKITFLDAQGLRPTADRLRETLFNWLAPTLADARCLDCFAGSGALGFEAASRGAQAVLLIDSHPQVCRQLRKQQALLSADQVTIKNAKMPEAMADLDAPFDVIFLDPPFASTVWQNCLQSIIDNQLLIDSGRVYLEVGQPVDDWLIGAKWEVHKQTRVGQVYAYLLSPMAA